MFRFVVLACFLATFAAAFTTSPSMLSQSRVAAAASPLAVAPMPRVAPGAVVMSGDGEHEVLYESASALELRTLHRCIFLNGGSHSLEGRTVSSGWGGAARTAHLRPNPKTRRGQFRWPLRLTLGHSTCGAATEPGGGWSRRGRTQRGKRPFTLLAAHETHARHSPLASSSCALSFAQCSTRSTSSLSCSRGWACSARWPSTCKFATKCQHQGGGNRAIWEIAELRAEASRNGP